MVPLLYIQELFTLTKTPAKVEFCAFYTVAAKNIEVITMTEYRRSAYSVYDIKYHLVWITKYRKSVLTVKIAERTGDLI